MSTLICTDVLHMVISLQRHGMASSVCLESLTPRSNCNGYPLYAMCAHRVSSHTGCFESCSSVPACVTVDFNMSAGMSPCPKKRRRKPCHAETGNGCASSEAAPPQKKRRERNHSIHSHSSTLLSKRPVSLTSVPSRGDRILILKANGS